MTGETRARRQQRTAVAAGLLAAAMVHAGSALACATCLCGDPTLSTMGTEKPFAGRTRVGLEYLARDETVGQSGVSEHEIDEKRLTFTMSYWPSERWAISAALPIVRKEVSRFDLSRQTSGPAAGDADLFARWYAGYEQRVMAPDLWGVQFGLRVPTSSEQKSNGVALSFDAQPGAGATVASLGLWYGRFASPWFFYASTAYQRALGTGYQGYKAGDVVLATVHGQYGLGHEFALSFSLDARGKKRDTYFGVVDNDSGGTLVMATPGFVWTPVTDLVVNLAVQFPALERLNGVQKEKPVFRLGVSYDF